MCPDEIIAFNWLLFAIFTLLGGMAALSFWGWFK